MWFHIRGWSSKPPRHALGAPTQFGGTPHPNKIKNDEFRYPMFNIWNWSKFKSQTWKPKHFPKLNKGEMKFFKPKSKLRKPMFQKTPIETQFLYSTIYSKKQYQQKSHKNSLTHKYIKKKKNHNNNKNHHKIKTTHKRLQESKKESSFRKLTDNTGSLRAHLSHS